MTALLEYLDLFIAESDPSNAGRCRSPWVLALLSTTAIDTIVCGTVMLSQ